MKKTLILPVLCLFLLAAACAPTKTPLLLQDRSATAAPTSALGSAVTVWKMDGYGQIAEMGKDRVQIYYATQKTCVPLGRPYPVAGNHLGGDTGPTFTISGDTLTIAASFYTQQSTYHRLSALPQVCADAALHAKDPQYAFEAFWNTFNETYPSFKLRGVDWQKTYDAVRPTVDAQTDDIALKRIFVEMVKPLKDCSISMESGYGGAPFSNPAFDDQPDWRSMGRGLTLNLGKTYLKEAQWTDSGRFYYGKLNASTGYWYIKFLGVAPQEGNDAALRKELDQIVTYFHGMSAVVIDARAVQYGGSAYYANLLAGHFTERATPAYTVQMLSDGKLTPAQTVTVTPAETTFFRGKLFALMSPLDSGATEQLLLQLKAVGATLVGEPSAGCLSESLSVPLPSADANSRSSFSLPYQVITTLDGKQYEKVGISPDVPVKMTLAEWAGGQDAILQRVIDLIAGK